MSTLNKKLIISYIIIILITLFAIIIGHRIIYKQTNLNWQVNYNINKFKNLNKKENDKILKKKNLKIMSYNIHRAKNSNNQHRLDDIIIFLSEKDADIICLQEVTSSQYEKIREMIKSSGKFVSNAKRIIISDGLATYSKYPIVESNHVLLTSKNEQRGFLHTSYKIDGKLINVINVHLGLDQSERAIQISEILSYIDTLKGETILVGDFNEKYIRLENFIDTGKYHGYMNNATFEALDTRIDYIFITTNSIYSTTYDVLKTDLSDHYPIMANIRYK